MGHPMGNPSIWEPFPPITAPAKSKTVDKCKGLSRATCAILIQIRTGKTRLNDCLYSVKKDETDRCNCRRGHKQTVDHVLTTCSEYADLRQHTSWKESRNTDMKTLLSEPATARRAAIFLARTGLLGKLGKACLVYTDAGEKNLPSE